MELLSLAPPPFGQAIDVAPGVSWLRMPLPFALDHVNLWLLSGRSGVAIVDCGYGDATTRSLWERHLATALKGKTIAAVVATHCHPDHLGNAAWLASHSGCTVTMTQGEFLAAHAMLAGGAGLGVADICGLFARHGMSGEHLAALAGRGHQYRRGVPEAPHAFHRILNDDPIALGGKSWRVISGYGHSPEHASLACPDAGLLVSGDMLLPRISTNVSVWPGEPDGDPVTRFLDSLARFETLPPDTLVLPSHGVPFRGIAERVAALRQHHAARLDELGAALAAAKAPQSAEQVIPVLFRRELDLQQRFFAMGEAIAHLNHLWHHGRAERLCGADGTIRFAA